MSHINKRLKLPDSHCQKDTNGSVGRTLKVNQQMQITIDRACLKEIEKWSRYNRARRLADEEATLAYADTKIAR